MKVYYWRSNESLGSVLLLRGVLEGLDLEVWIFSVMTIEEGSIVFAEGVEGVGVVQVGIILDGVGTVVRDGEDGEVSCVVEDGEDGEEEITILGVDLFLEWWWSVFLFWKAGLGIRLIESCQYQGSL